MSEAEAKMLAKAIWNEAGRVACIFLVIWTLALIGKDFITPHDSTDGTDRSGLTILTDCHTGGQYLTTARGGLTPRLGSDGLQIVEPCP